MKYPLIRAAYFGRLGGCSLLFDQPDPQLTNGPRV